jgi:hypothetical protein
MTQETFSAGQRGWHWQLVAGVAKQQEVLPHGSQIGLRNKAQPGSAHSMHDKS